MSYSLVILHNDQVISVTGRWPSRGEADRAARTLAGQLREQAEPESDPFAKGYEVRVAPVRGTPR